METPILYGMLVFLCKYLSFRQCIWLAAMVAYQVPSASITRTKYAAFKGKTVNLRAGPDKEHTLLWTYNAPGWPVVIMKKFYQWYYVKDCLGAEGWVGGSMLRFVSNVVTQKPTMLHTKPYSDSGMMASLQKNVILRYLQQKSSGWIFVVIPKKNIKGWVREDHVWPQIKE